MATQRMHADELEIDTGLVGRLLSAQFPQWADRPLERVPSSGTDNALYRLGGDLVVRLPRIDSAVGGLEKELRVLPVLAPLLPVDVPLPLGEGAPGEGYPWPWAVYSWLDGRNPTLGAAGDADALVEDATALLRALRRVDPTGGPVGGRVSLARRDEAVRRGLTALRGTLEVEEAAAAWKEALAAPNWSGRPVWTHGDLLPVNVLLRGGRLTGVIDWGVAGVGDPACDMLFAWGLLPQEARRAFRDELGVDDATWARGRGWALAVGLIGIPYYENTNPHFAAMGRYLVDEVLRDDREVRRGGGPQRQ